MFNIADNTLIRQKEFKKVGTHNGRFHADEVMSTAILNELYNIEVVRTRDMEVLNTLDLVYDVGGGEFDHHDIQKRYRETRTPYAACGLIWDNFGREVVRLRESSLEDGDVEDAFRIMDAILIEGIDAIDNGLNTVETIIPTMNVSAAISGFNPAWDAEISEDTAFENAVSFASSILNNTLEKVISRMRARAYVTKAFENRPRPELLLLDRNYPWPNTLQEIDIEREVLFVIYPRESQYMIQTVRDRGRTFEDRKKLPAAWAGKREEELNEIIGINDAIFCHAARFIAGANSFESIMKMAELAIAEPVEEKQKHPPQVDSFLNMLKRFLMGKKQNISK